MLVKLYNFTTSSERIESVSIDWVTDEENPKDTLVSKVITINFVNGERKLFMDFVTKAEIIADEVMSELTQNGDFWSIKNHVFNVNSILFVEQDRDTLWNTIHFVSGKTIKVKAISEQEHEVYAQLLDMSMYLADHNLTKI